MGLILVFAVLPSYVSEYFPLFPCFLVYKCFLDFVVTKRKYGTKERGKCFRA